MNKNIKIFSISFVAILAIATAYIHSTYLYNPINYPNGNLYPIKWNQFKYPLDIECLSWSEKGNKVLYEPSQGDVTEVKYILEGFAKMETVEDYNNDKYYAHLPEIRGKEYTVLVRQVKNRDVKRKVNGNILLQLKFFENDNIAVINGVRFYKIPDEYKKHIIEKYSLEQR